MAWVVGLAALTAAATGTTALAHTYASRPVDATVIPDNVNFDAGGPRCRWSLIIQTPELTSDSGFSLTFTDTLMGNCITPPRIDKSECGTPRPAGVWCFPVSSDRGPARCDDHRDRVTNPKAVAQYRVPSTTTPTTPTTPKPPTTPAPTRNLPPLPAPTDGSQVMDVLDARSPKAGPRRSSRSRVVVRRSRRPRAVGCRSVIAPRPVRTRSWR